MIASPSLLCIPDGMTLIELLDRYIAAIECSPRYQESLRRTIRKATAYGITHVCQLTCERANDFLASIRLAPTTRSNIRRELCTLWRFAFDREWTDEYPSRVRKIRAKYAPPQAWTPQQMKYMVSAAEEDQTFVSERSTLRRRDVLPAWIGIGYDSGIRFSDIHGLCKQNIRNGCVALVANKTGKPLVRRLSKETLEAVRTLATKSPDGSLFEWALSRRMALNLWRKFLDEHSLGGSSKWLRRTVATQLHKKRHGAATDFLQHSQDNLALRHYIDQTQLDPPIVPPSFRRFSFRRKPR